jgi:hypothetical protein
LTADGVKEEMLLLEEAMINILGYFPYYMRPPFLSVNAVALQALKELQYHVIIGDLNTKDWQYQTESGIETAKKLFTDGLDIGRTIVEAHEQEVWTHGVLIDFMIQTIQARGLKSKGQIHSVELSQRLTTPSCHRGGVLTGYASISPSAIHQHRK